MILSAHCAALVLQSTLPLPSQRGADSLQLLGRIGEGGLNPERYAGTLHSSTVWKSESHVARVEMPQASFLQERQRDFVDLTIRREPD